MQRIIIWIFFSSAFLLACGGDKQENSASTTKVTAPDYSEVAKKMEAKEKAQSVDNELSEIMENKGIGPVKSVVIAEEIDQAMVKKGHQIFKIKCTACHKIGKKKIGPPLKGITQRRSPEWIMNMILNPEEMVAKDKIAKELIKKYTAPMANQSLTKNEARALYEYFRTKN